VISPVPSRLGCRVCIATQSRSGGRSSKTSSTVTSRSLGGIEPSSALSVVVLPDWVPPDTRTVRPAATAASRKRAAAGGSVPSRTRSSTDFAGATNFRTLTARCRPVTSGRTACSRDPSGSVASTNVNVR
jgi:hypothetical protein